MLLRASLSASPTMVLPLVNEHIRQQTLIIVDVLECGQALAIVTYIIIFLITTASILHFVLILTLDRIIMMILDGLIFTACLWEALKLSITIVAYLTVIIRVFVAQFHRLHTILRFCCNCDFIRLTTTTTDTTLIQDIIKQWLSVVGQRQKSRRKRSPVLVTISGTIHCHTRMSGAILRINRQLLAPLLFAFMQCSTISSAYMIVYLVMHPLKLAHFFVAVLVLYYLICIVLFATILILNESIYGCTHAALHPLQLALPSDAILHKLKWMLFAECAATTVKASGNSARAIGFTIGSITFVTRLVVAEIVASYIAYLLMFMKIVQS